MGQIPFFPKGASTFSPQVDFLFLVLVGLSAFFAFIVMFAIVYFVIKYRKGTNADRSNPVNSSVRLEIFWTVVPLVLALGVFFGAAKIFFDMHRAPKNSLDVYVVAKQWMWKFQHPEGQREINELHIPVNRPVRVIMISQDVIHSFFVPAFRVKQDVLPNRYTTAWFQATQPGEYHLFCAQYCGTDHAKMVGTVIVMDPAKYEEWLTETASPPAVAAQPAAGSASAGGVVSPQGGGAAASSSQSLAQEGEKDFQTLGCIACHNPNGSGVAPSLVGLYGTSVTLQDGTTVTADEEYIRTSILNPQAQIVKGYPPIMPAFQGQVSNDQLTQLVAYIKSLGQGQDGASTK